MAKNKKTKKTMGLAAHSKSSISKTKGTIIPIIKSENVPATQGSITHLKKTLRGFS